ncbi:zeatin O-glucosyltransferase-like [Andrographis paniculata]|uniref:zeatin O-glucosyltransferase-like n=1 Tax=Andrographis paniculata TaxID=175694 RepID=UPI0021E749B2|nr:zeatin O-glucosyltransferase-like [Andrographis paniculata]
MAEARGRECEVAVVIVPLPAQGHLNQLLHLSCLISSYNITVSFLASPLHTRQAKARINGVHPHLLAKIHFHQIPLPDFPSPPPDRTSPTKFPSHLCPSFLATTAMRQPFADHVRHISTRYRRVVVVHDSMMSFVVQDVPSIPNAETYALNCISAFSLSYFAWKPTDSPPPPAAADLFAELPSFEGSVTDEIQQFTHLQYKALNHRSGDLYNTCRLIESPFLETLQIDAGNRKSWAIGPILPPNPSSKRHHKSLQWLDKHEPDSVLYISFGTTTTMCDEEIAELAKGLEQSKVKFLWVLREADKGNIFSGEPRRAVLPEGFEQRVEGVGLVVRDWAPQPEILAHPATGGFVSHCGWNSCIESIMMGVAMAAWPMHSDQPANAALVTRVLKTGLLVRPWSGDKEVVKASSIESVVRRLMASEEGDGLRSRAKEVGAAVQRAVQPGGASRLELDSFIAHITR